MRVGPRHCHACTKFRWQNTWESDSRCPRHLGLDVQVDGGRKMLHFCSKSPHHVTQVHQEEFLGSLPEHLLIDELVHRPYNRPTRKESAALQLHQPGQMSRTGHKRVAIECIRGMASSNSTTYQNMMFWSPAPSSR